MNSGRSPGFRDETRFPSTTTGLSSQMRPAFSRSSRMAPTLVPRRYDAFLYLEETHALDPLHMPALVDGEVPETYPSGM